MNPGAYPERVRNQRTKLPVYFPFWKVANTRVLGHLRFYKAANTRVLGHL